MAHVREKCTSEVMLALQNINTQSLRLGSPDTQGPVLKGGDVSVVPPNPTKSTEGKGDEGKRTLHFHTRPKGRENPEHTKGCHSATFSAIRFQENGSLLSSRSSKIQKRVATEGRIPLSTILQNEVAHDGLDAEQFLAPNRKNKMANVPGESTLLSPESNPCIPPSFRPLFVDKAVFSSSFLLLFPSSCEYFNWLEDRFLPSMVYGEVPGTLCFLLRLYLPPRVRLSFASVNQCLQGMPSVPFSVSSKAETPLTSCVSNDKFSTVFSTIGPEQKRRSQEQEYFDDERATAERRREKVLWWAQSYEEEFFARSLSFSSGLLSFLIKRKMLDRQREVLFHSSNSLPPFSTRNQDASLAPFSPVYYHGFPISQYFSIPFLALQIFSVLRHKMQMECRKKSLTKKENHQRQYALQQEEICSYKLRKPQQERCRKNSVEQKNGTEPFVVTSSPLLRTYKEKVIDDKPEVEKEFQGSDDHTVKMMDIIQQDDPIRTTIFKYPTKTQTLLLLVSSTLLAWKMVDSCASGKLLHAYATQKQSHPFTTTLFSTPRKPLLLEYSTDFPPTDRLRQQRPHSLERQLPPAVPSIAGCHPRPSSPSVPVCSWRSQLEERNSLDDFSFVSRSDIVHMERFILRMINFRIGHPPLWWRVAVELFHLYFADHCSAVTKEKENQLKQQQQERKMGPWERKEEVSCSSSTLVDSNRSHLSDAVFVHLDQKLLDDNAIAMHNGLECMFSDMMAFLLLPSSRVSLKTSLSGVFPFTAPMTAEEKDEDNFERNTDAEHESHSFPEGCFVGSYRKSMSENSAITPFLSHPLLGFALAARHGVPISWMLSLTAEGEREKFLMAIQQLLYFIKPVREAEEEAET